MMKTSAIGIDLGCTNIKAAVVDADGTVVAERRVETREYDDKYWKEAVKSIIETLRASTGSVVKTIGLCAPGLANADNSAIACMPGRLPGLEQFHWSAFLGEPVHVLNDAHAALTAEAAFGAAKGCRHAVLVTLGSGVGGAILIDGKLYQGLGQMAGHLGHITVNANDFHLDVTNMPGSIEDAIGNVTIAERSRGKYETTFQLIDAYREGNAFASWLWLDAVRKLSVSIASLINILSPEVVVVGGGISLAGDALFKPLEEFLALYEWRPGGKQTVIRAAQYSDMAGALGAAAFALSKQS